MQRILHLTLKAHPFALIASGIKSEEYRDWKPYWTNRLLKNGLKDVCATWAGDNTRWKEYDIIRFKNGYSKDSPEMDVEWKGISLGIGKHEWGASGDKQIKIQLGKILSIKNYK